MVTGAGWHLSTVMFTPKSPSGGASSATYPLRAFSFQQFSTSVLTQQGWRVILCLGLMWRDPAHRTYQRPIVRRLFSFDATIDELSEKGRAHDGNSRLRADGHHREDQ